MSSDHGKPRRGLHKSAVPQQLQSRRPESPFRKGNDDAKRPQHARRGLRGPASAAMTGTMNSLNNSRTMLSALSDKVGNWNTFVSRTPVQWSTPAYYTQSPRPKTTNPALSKPPNNTSSYDLATKQLSINGYILQPWDKPTGQSEFPEVTFLRSCSTVTKRAPKLKSKKKDSASGASAWAPAPVAANPVFEMRATGATMKGKSKPDQDPAPTERMVNEVDSMGDTDYALLILTKEHMLQNVASNAREVLGHPNLFPITVFTQDSTSDIDLKYEQQKRQGAGGSGLNLSDRYAKHGDGSLIRKMATIHESNMSAQNSSENGNIKSQIISAAPSVSRSNKTIAVPGHLLSLLAPVAKRINPRPKSKEVRLDRKPAPVLSLRNLRKSASLAPKPLVKGKSKPREDKGLQLSNDIKAAVAAITQLSKHEKLKTSVGVGVAPRARAKRQRSAQPATRSGSAAREESNHSKKRTPSASKQKGKRKSLANVKSNEIALQLQTTEQAASEATPSAKEPATLKNARRKRPTSAEPKPIGIDSLPLPPHVDHFSRAQHKLIEHQWNHVLGRQTVLEAEVLQLLAALQEKVNQNNNPSVQQPCHCGSETREQLEGIIRKQKEVIQLQTDLHQRYGLHQFASAAATTFGRSRPILNAFEAHYDQLSVFAREMDGKMMYYCAPCNFAAKDELAFRTHLESSGHVVRTYQGIVKHQPSFSCQHCSQQFSGTTKYLSHVVCPDGKGGASPKCAQDPKPKKSFQVS